MTDLKSNGAVLASTQLEDTKQEQHLPSSLVPTKVDEETIRTEESPVSAEITLDHVPWKGWAELENDPVIFTTILRAWGVQGVRVNEVIPLDAILEKDPLSVLGLVFLSRYASQEVPDQVQNCPDDLWFANQISTYSCATLALMNIVNNQPNIHLGPELWQFKQETAEMSSKERGLKLDRFQYVKDIHNSFSRELDRLTVDLRVKEEAQASARRSRNSKKLFTRRKKTKYLDEEDENSFHFVAYVPAHGHLWRLDGMETNPRDMGNVGANETWLAKIIGDLQIILEVSETEGTEFSLLSLDLESSTDEAEESLISRMREDWSPFIAHMLRLHAEKGDLETLLGLC